MLFHCHEKLIRANAVTMQRPINNHKARVMMAAAIAGILAATTDYAAAQEVNAPVEVTQAAEAATDVTVEQAFDSLIAEAKEQMMTDPALAVETATKAAQLVETIDEFENRDRSMATALWLKGEAYLRSGQPEAGQPLVASALILLGDADAKSKLRADLLLAQGRIAGRAADMELAVRSYYEAHDIFVVLKEARNEAITLMALGSIYRDAEAYDKALSYYERAAEIYSGDARIDLSSANNRASILKELGRHGEARDLFHDALAVAKNMESDVLQGRILTNLADNEVSAGNLSLGGRIRIPRASGIWRRQRHGLAPLRRWHPGPHSPAAGRCDPPLNPLSMLHSLTLIWRQPLFLSKRCMMLPSRFTPNSATTKLHSPIINV